MSRIFDWLAVKNTPLFISNSRHGAEYLTRFFGVDPAKIEIVYNAVELPLPVVSRSAWRERLGAGEADIVAVMVANLHSNKDHATLVRAWRLVLAGSSLQGRKAILALAGYQGDTYGQLQELTEELGIADAVRFLGQVNDISGLVHAADIGVFSSRSEGMPNGVLECMAAGLPVVGTDIPGIRESVSSDNYELLVPVGDHRAFSEHIQKLATSPESRRLIGEANRSRIKAVFNRQKICEQMVGLITASLPGTGR
jgi:glycosyltransferase involved in cell wall biosynthesis